MVDDCKKKEVHRYGCKAIVVTHFSFVRDFDFVFYLFVVYLFVVQFYFVSSIILFLLRKKLKLHISQDPRQEASITLRANKSSLSTWANKT